MATWEAVCVPWNPDTWIVIERDGDKKRRIAVCEPSAYMSAAQCEVNAKRIVLAHNAEVVQMRRGWNPARYPANKKWFVPFHSPKFETILSREKSGYKHYHADPFTALVEADKWYTANIEGEGK